MGISTSVDTREGELETREGTFETSENVNNISKIRLNPTLKASLRLAFCLLYFYFTLYEVFYLAEGL